MIKSTVAFSMLIWLYQLSEEYRFNYCLMGESWTFLAAKGIWEKWQEFARPKDAWRPMGYLLPHARAQWQDDTFHRESFRSMVPYQQFSQKSLYRAPPAATRDIRPVPHISPGNLHLDRVAVTSDSSDSRCRLIFFTRTRSYIPYLYRNLIQTFRTFKFGMYRFILTIEIILPKQIGVNKCRIS